MLAGIFAVVASHVAATPSGAPVVPFSPSGVLSPLFAAAPVVDLSPDDDETARELKDRTTVDGAAPSNGRLADVHLFFADTPEAESAPTGRIAFSLGPRAPPRAHNFDLRRLAWQA